MDNQIEHKVLLKYPQQCEWHVPALVNFSIGGMGGSFYLLSFLSHRASGGMANAPLPISINILASLLVCIGFLSLAYEAGRPLRAVYLFSNQKKSWMSREALFGTLFVITSSIECFYHNSLISALAVFLSFGFIISQGFIVRRAKGIPAWHTPIIPVLFSTSSLLMGFGFLLIFCQFPTSLSIADSMIPLCAILVIINMLTWLCYIWRNRLVPSNEFQINLFKRSYFTVVILLGHILPLCICSILVADYSMHINKNARETLITLAGLLMLIGGMKIKTIIIKDDSQYRPIKFER